MTRRTRHLIHTSTKGYDCCRVRYTRGGHVAESVNNHGAFVWSIAELLRGDYTQSDYQKVILPLVVIRRLDAVLEPTKDAVLAAHDKYKGKVQNLEPVLEKVSGEQFYNTSQLTFKKLLDDPAMIADNPRAYLAGFSPSARDVIDKFEFDTQITKLDNADLLYSVVGKLAELDLHPDTVSNEEMGYLYEELIRKFTELSNETAGEHFTPREVIELMVNLLFIEDDDVLARSGVVRTIYDPAAGTEGMLAVAEKHLRSMNPNATLEVFGQELNAKTYAVCRTDMMIKGQNAENTINGNSLSGNGFTGRTFDYMLAIISMKVPVPPISEQSRIVELFWSQADNIDSVVDKTRTQLTLLTEYREALTTAAVTGEIDVDTFDGNRHMEEATA